MYPTIRGLTKAENFVTKLPFYRQLESHGLRFVNSCFVNFVNVINNFSLFTVSMLIHCFPMLQKLKSLYNLTFHINSTIHIARFNYSNSNTDRSLFSPFIIGLALCNVHYLLALHVRVDGHAIYCQKLRWRYHPSSKDADKVKPRSAG